MTEAEIPRMTYEIFSGLKRVKAGMLMLNYIAMEVLEAHPLPPFSLPPPSSLLSISHVLSISTTRPTSNTTQPQHGRQKEPKEQGFVTAKRHQRLDGLTTRVHRRDAQTTGQGRT